MLGEQDVLLCADHGLLALDTDMQSLAELKELITLLPDETSAPATTRRSPAGPKTTTRNSAA
jgi:hypothetical protein